MFPILKSPKFDVQIKVFVLDNANQEKRSFSDPSYL